MSTSNFIVPFTGMLVKKIKASYKAKRYFLNLVNEYLQQIQNCLESSNLLTDVMTKDIFQGRNNDFCHNRLWIIKMIWQSTFMHFHCMFRFNFS